MTRYTECHCLNQLTDGIDLFEELRCHPQQSLAVMPLPADYQLVVFEIIPSGGAMALICCDDPVWLFRWRMDSGVAVIYDWRAFWYRHTVDLSALPMCALFWLADRHPIRWQADNGAHFWQRFEQQWDGQT